ncbi:MAG: hypothetical protein AAGI23_08040 [Bacteroidota bacterium]
MKYTVLLLLLSSNFLILSAQTKYPVTIGVLPLENKNTSATNASRVHNTILVLLNQDNRFQVIDISARDKVDAEKEKQKEIDFLEGTIVEQHRNQGAEFILSGTINSLGATYDKEQKRYISYCNISLHLYNVVTNTLVASELVTEKARSKSNGAFVVPSLAIPTENGTVRTQAVKINKKVKVTAEEAIDKMLSEQMPIYIGEIVEKAFPSEIEIFEIQEVVRKNNSSFLNDKISVNKRIRYDALIVGGKELGITKNSWIKIISRKPVQANGKIVYYEEEIGRMQLLKLHGEFSRFRIIKGDIEVMKSILEDDSIQLIARY